VRPRVIGLARAVAGGWVALELALVVVLTWSEGGLGAKVLRFVLLNAAVIVLAEVVFQIATRLVTGRFYVRVPKLSFADIYMEPHPHITVVYKARFPTHPSMPVHYALSRGRRFRSIRMVTNNYRHLDGPGGDRDITVPKPPATVRVLCLGESTTGNYLEMDGVVSSYPLELEALLRARFPGRHVVVHNCGHGGWTSADILIDFLLNLYDTDPDVVIIYHAYNDLAASLTPGFRSDYSHARRNFGEVYHLYRKARYIPDVPLGFFNFVVNSLFPYLNPRFGVIEATSRGAPDLKGEFRGLETYRRNIEHIVKVCQAGRIDVVLSTYAHLLYDEVRHSPVHLKYREGVLQENEQILDVGRTLGVPVVDNFTLTPSEEKYFVDSIHLSPDGMRLLAQNFAEEVAPLVGARFAALPGDQDARRAT